MGATLTDPRVRFFGLPLAVATLAALWAMFGSAWLFPELSSNSDEGIYLLQADALREGRLTLPAPAEDPEAFVPWFSVIDDGRYILKYTPAHAGVLALGQAAGSARLALGAIAAAQILGIAALARALGFERNGVAATAALMAASPLFIQLSITYLPYGTSLSLALFSAAAAVYAARRGSARLAALAGLLWGLALFARPYDAVLWGAAILIGLGIDHREDLGERMRSLAPPAILGAALPIGLLLAFNLAVTGELLQLPFNLLEPMDKLGFGPRRALPTDPTIDFTPARGLAATGRNLLLVLGWGGGGLVGVGFGVHHLWRRGTGWAAIGALLVVWPIGYSIFWGSYLTVFVWDGGLFLGPYYFLPMVAGFALAGGAGIAEFGRENRSLRWAAAAAAAVLTLAVGVPRLAEQGDRSSQRSELAAVVAGATTDLDGPTLVFLPPIYGEFLLNPWGFLRNTPSIDGSVVFALQGAPTRDERIATRYPDRWVLRVDIDRWTDRPGFEPDIEVTTVRAPLDQPTSPSEP
ncbi:MAG: hypothetical protein RIB98_11500 [Acidimicrobiales bacterium]